MDIVSPNAAGPTDITPNTSLSANDHHRTHYRYALGSCHPGCNKTLVCEYRAAIKALRPCAQAVSWDAAKWTTSNTQWNGHLRSFTTGLGKRNKISRCDILKYLCSPNPDYEAAFLMVMIWGYGPAGYGPSRVGAMFHHKAFTSIIKSTVSHLVANPIKLRQAYRECGRLPNLGPNFFSKFFYFVGRAKGLPQYPLIFDDRVATALVKLHACCSVLDDMTSIHAKRNYNAYERYVNLLHDWATHLGCDADQIELFLFNNGGRSGIWTSGTSEAERTSGSAPHVNGGIQNCTCDQIAPDHLPKRRPRANGGDAWVGGDCCIVSR